MKFMNGIKVILRIFGISGCTSRICVVDAGFRNCDEYNHGECKRNTGE